MRWTLAFIFGLFLFCGSMTAEAGVFGHDGCPPWRPCGWGNPFGGNRLIPQGFHGADFRFACQAHDDCYASGCNRRIDCDRQFRANMHCRLRMLEPSRPLSHEGQRLLRRLPALRRHRPITIQKCPASIVAGTPYSLPGPGSTAK